MAILDRKPITESRVGGSKRCDDDADDGEYEVIQSGHILSPREVSPGIQTPRSTQQGEEEYNERMEQKRKRLKNRAKTAVKKTGKVVTSSYTCAVCISLSGLVTMICGIIMVVIGNNKEEIRNDRPGQQFMVIGGSIFFIFGLAMLTIAIVYAVVHFIRKRQKDAKDPFAIKAEEKARQERETAINEGRVVAPGPTRVASMPAVQMPVIAVEHEHESVTERRIKEGARRQSLFLATPASTPDDVHNARTPPPPLKKAQSAFELKGLSGLFSGRKSKLPPIKQDNNVDPMGGSSPLPPIKKGASVFELQQYSSQSANVNKDKKVQSKGMHKSKSAAVITETTQVEAVIGIGLDSPSRSPRFLGAGDRRASAFELGHANARPNSGRPNSGRRSSGAASRATTLHVISDIADFESD